MFKILCSFTVILLTYLIKFSNAKHDESQTVLNFLDFDKIKINLFTRNRTKEFHYKDFTQNDEECMIELNEIGNGLNNMELWAIKRKSF